MANFTNGAIYKKVPILQDNKGSAALELPTTSANVPVSTQFGAINNSLLTNYYKPAGVTVATDGTTSLNVTPVVAIPESVPAAKNAAANFKPTYVESNRKPAAQTNTGNTGNTGGTGGTKVDTSNYTGYQAQLGDLYDQVMGYKPYQSTVDVAGANQTVNNVYNQIAGYAPYQSGAGV